MTGPRTRWTAGLIAGLVGCLVFVLVPEDNLASSVVYQVVALSALVVLITTTLRMPSGTRAVWWSVIAYAALTEAGDILYDIQVHLLDEPPYPGPADAFYLAAYVAAMAAVALLINRAHRGRNLEAWIDAAILSLAAASVVGILIIEPILMLGDETGVATLVSVVYPLFDLVLLAGLTRLLVGRAQLNPSVMLLSLAFGATLIADLLFSYFAANGIDSALPAWLDVLYLVAFIAMAAAANAPGATSLAARPSMPEDATRPVRILALSIGALTLPVVLAYASWDDGEIADELLAAACILVLALVLWRFRLLLDVVQRQAARLTSLARTDALTGLPNRRTLDFELERLEAWAEAEGRPLTVAMLDLDHFKAFNDMHGHQAGDAALTDCARTWRSLLDRLAPDDGPVLARYGGEEFAVLLPGRGLRTAEPLLERLRAETPDGQTVSIGFAERRPGESGYETMSRADRALYRAKQTGRNRVETDRPRDVSEAAG